jgi:hypothetical protein
MRTPRSWRRTAAIAVTIAATVTLTAERQAPDTPRFAPGERVWLDAHNCYNHDEIDRALEQPLPVSIEEDLNWYQGRSVVSHGGEDVKTAPDLETYFFDKVKPIVENALKDNNRATWPIMILHFDFKTNEPEHHKFVLALLHKYEAWLTTAPRTATPAVPAPFTVGPVLVLTENNDQQQADFHDSVPIGEKLLLFGSIRDAQVPGATTEEKAANAATVSAETLIPVEATNYRRWVNFPWAVVEAGGQGKAGDWTTTDESRLRALVERAHAMHLWIRFYTLNGEDGKPAGGYNFGSAAAVLTRWKAAIDAQVDFLATDQYEQLARIRAARLGGR